jgi:hypothetical protein
MERKVEQNWNDPDNWDDPIPEEYSDEAVEVQGSICKQICPLLANQHPRVIGAILVELTSKWLAGHILTAAVNGEKNLDAVQSALMDPFLQAVTKLAPIEACRVVELASKIRAEAARSTKQ